VFKGFLTIVKRNSRHGLGKFWLGDSGVYKKRKTGMTDEFFLDVKE